MNRKNQKASVPGGAFFVGSHLVNAPPRRGAPVRRSLGKELNER